MIVSIMSVFSEKYNTKTISKIVGENDSNRWFHVIHALDRIRAECLSDSNISSK